MDDKTPKLAQDILKLAGNVARMSDALCRTRKEKNDWKKRMLSTLHGLHFPDGFDKLSEKEREHRLDLAVDIATEAIKD